MLFIPVSSQGVALPPTDREHGQDSLGRICIPVQQFSLVGLPSEVFAELKPPQESVSYLPCCQGQGNDQRKT